MTEAPTLFTERLCLRPHRMSDFEPFWAFYQSDRAVHVDAPKNKTHLWYGLASETGSWALAGWGGWAVEMLEGELIGQVALTQPPHFPELELGWILFDGFEGKGFACEAAKAALNYAYDVLDVATLVSYIDRRNARSIALARRLGAYEDPDAARYDEVDLVFRHPHPEEVQGGMEAYA